MKYILIHACGFIFCFTISKTNSQKREGGAVPKELLCGDSMSWVLSKVSAPGFVKAEPEPGNSVIVKARFDKGGHYMLAFQKNDTAKAIQAYTVIEGNAKFISNWDGSNILATQATWGKEFITENGVEISKTIETRLLKSVYSNTYLWERMNFTGISNEDFLLLVNLDEHPTANTKIKRKY